MSDEQVQARRDRARKAFEECPYDEHDCTSCSRDRAIEVATRITADEVSRALDAFRKADVQHIKHPDFMKLRMTHRLAVALAELGFEVSRSEREE